MLQMITFGDICDTYEKCEDFLKNTNGWMNTIHYHTVFPPGYTPLEYAFYPDAKMPALLADFAKENYKNYFIISEKIRDNTIYFEFPKHLQTDERLFSIWLAKKKIDIDDCIFASLKKKNIDFSHLADDYNLCKIAIANDADNFYYISEELQNNLELCKLMVLQLIHNVVNDTDIRHINGARVVKETKLCDIINKEGNCYEICKNICDKARYYVYIALFKKFPYRIKNDYQYCKYTITKNPLAFPYCSDNIRDNYNIALIAVSKCPDNLEYVSDRLKNNYEICKIAIAKYAPILKFASKNIKNNFSICAMAASVNPSTTVQFVSRRLKKNKKFCKIAIDKDPMSIKFMSDHIKSDITMCKLAYAKNPESVKYFDNKTKIGELGAPLNP